MANDKTEKATPKRLEEARKKGQVARSQDLTGSVVLLVGLMVLGVTGASMAQRMADVMQHFLARLGSIEDLTPAIVGPLLLECGKQVGMALAPVVGACMLAAIVVNVAQVGFKPRVQALKPDPKRLNPASGLKQLVGPNSLVETGKNIFKVAAVAVVVLSALLPHLPEFASQVGMSPIELGTRLAADVKGIALRATLAYLGIGVLDFFYQKHRHAKNLRMDKQEVRDEAKGQDLPAEVRGAIRRRQMSAARARMMDAVPTADVVVTNPTHYSVALKYDGTSAAPEVVAKGKDIIAFRIRELATEHGVPIIPDPPLARSLHATVEVGDEIPEELFAAVAQILAYVFRVAGRRPRPASDARQSPSRTLARA